jgi:hypothetical protein
VGDMTIVRTGGFDFAQQAIRMSRCRTACDGIEVTKYNTCFGESATNRRFIYLLNKFMSSIESGLMSDIYQQQLRC